MSFQAPLAAPQYNKLRSPSYGGVQYVTLFSNTVVFAGQINSDLTGSGSWAQFNYTSITVGAYTDVVPDMELFIGTANDIQQARYIGRARLAANATTLFVNESSENFEVGTYFWVVNNYVPQYRLSRPSTNDPATAVELIDYNQTFQQLAPQTVGLQTGYADWIDFTTGKLRIAYDVSRSYAGTSGSTISAFSWNTGGTIVAGSDTSSIIVVDYDPGEYRDSVTVTDTGGRTTVRHISIKSHDFANPPNTATNQVSISGNLDQGYTATVPYFAEVDDILINTFAVVWRGDERYGREQGSLYGGGSATITNKAVTSNVATITTSADHLFRAGEKVVVCSNDTTFNGTFTITATTATTFSYALTHANTSGSASGLAVVNAQNVDFVGWLQQEDDPVTGDANASVLSQANFQFTGVGARMARMTSQLLGFTLNPFPTLWGQIVNLTPWRAMLHFLQRYTTVANLCDITFDSTDNTFLFPAISAQGGNALESVKGIARQINALIEFAPWGALAINREVFFLSTVQRAALTTVGSWDLQDIIYPNGITRTYDPIPAVGKVDGDGGAYNTTTSQVVVYTSRAPGIAQGEGSGSDSLSAQILAAAANTSASVNELRQRVGDALVLANDQEYLDVDHPDGYGGVFFIPSHTQLWTWTLDTSLAGSHNVNRILYTTAVAWVVESVTSSYNADLSTRTVKVRYKRVFGVGSLGDNTTTNVPAPGEIPPLPDLPVPAFPWEPPIITFPDDPVPGIIPPPPGPNIANFNGQELIVTSPTTAWWLRNFIALSVPTALDITPPDLGSETIIQPMISPFYTNSAVPGYVATTDNTDSRVYYAPNVATTGPLWTAGATFSGVVQVMRATMTASSIMVYTSSGSSSIYTDPLTTGLGSKSFLVSATYPFGTYANSNAGAYSATGGRTGGGCIQGQNTGVTDGGFLKAEGDVVVDLGAEYTVSAFSFWYKSSANGQPFGYNVKFYDSAQALVASAAGGNPPSSTTWAQAAWTGSETGVQYVSFNTNSNFIQCITFVDDLSVTYGSGGGNAAVRLSTDDGAVFGSELVVGTSPGGVGGFDVQRSGGNSFAAADDIVARATTIGGTYSSYYSITGGTAQAACIIVPYYTWAGVKQTSATNPDILVGLTALDGSSRSLLWIEGGASPGTVHDLTPVANFLFSNPNSITVDYNHHIMVFGTVSGAAKCYRTTNRGSSWSEVTGRTNPTFIRGRRNDTSAKTSGTNLGQIYIADADVIGYSSKWASAGFSNRTMPTSGITAFDTVF